MTSQTKEVVKQLRVMIGIIVILFITAAMIISFYSRVDIFNAFQIVFIQILTSGTGGLLGNIFYVSIVFLTLGITFFIFEKVIILLSQIKVGGIIMKANLSSIKDHYIICGAGRVGMHAAEKLKEAGKKIVVIESDCERAESMRSKGYIVIEGDCVNEDVLEKAKITKARGLIAATGEDQKNVFVILTSKDLNPNMRIAARVNDQNSKNEFERAGANIIVTPEVTGGYELAEKISKE